MSPSCGAAGTVQLAVVSLVTVQVARLRSDVSLAPLSPVLVTPKYQLVAPVKPLPLTVTVPPPASGPLVRLRLRTTAAYFAFVVSAPPTTPLTYTSTDTAVAEGVPVGAVMLTAESLTQVTGAGSPSTVAVIFLLRKAM